MTTMPCAPTPAPRRQPSAPRVLRVLFASHSGALEGGAALSCLELVTGLKHDGEIEPVVTVPRQGALADALEARGVRWLSVPTPLWTPWTPEGYRASHLSTRVHQRSRRLAAITLGLRSWTALLREENPDVVVTNTAAIPVPALSSRILSIPHVWRLHEFVTRDHGISYLFGEALSQRLIGWLSRAVVANSNAVANHFSPPITRTKMRVVYSGVDVVPVGANRIEPGSLRVLVLGRQTPRKGSEVAVRAVAALKSEHPTISLRLVGPVTPEYRSHLLRVAAQLDVADRVELLGFTPRPSEQLEWSNVVLMCSVAEAFGRATVEALKSGRPVIGTRGGGTPEIIADGIDGLLAEPGVEGLASAIHQLAKDHGLLALMSEHARDRNSTRFTAEEEVEQFSVLLRQCADCSED